MQPILKSEIFFFISSVSTIIITILLVIVLIYLILILRKIKNTLDHAETKLENVKTDLVEFRNKFVNGIIISSFIKTALSKIKKSKLKNERNKNS